MTSPLLRPGKLGTVETRNRVSRPSTSETLADENGCITRQYRKFHLWLARTGVGLIVTGHVSVHPRGRCIRGITQLDCDELSLGLPTFTDAIHSKGAKISRHRLAGKHPE